jgi:hypothetical protein
VATHRFTVNIPNSTARSTTAELRLERVRPAQLRKLDLALPDARLELEHAEITLDPCARGDTGLKLRLKAYESVDVYVMIETAPPADPAVGGAVALNLVDRRPEQEGGVLLLAVDPPLGDPPGNPVPAPNPCPVTLDSAPYFVDVDGDPVKPVRQTLPLGQTMDLVAPLVNPSRSRLANVTAYLEHLGACDAAFVPVLWSIGALRRDPFYAVWTIAASGSLAGTFDLSIIVQDDSTDPTRISVPIRIARPRGD